MIKPNSSSIYLKTLLLFVLLASAILLLIFFQQRKNLFSKAAGENSSIEIRSSSGAQLPTVNGVSKTNSKDVKARISYSSSASSPSPTTPPNSGGPFPSVYDMKVLIIKYFPVTQDNRIDTNYTGDVGDSYETIRQKTISIENALIQLLPKASKYLGYKNSNAESSLRYSIVDTFEHKTFVPFNQTTRVPLYSDILNEHHICDYVNNQGVNEVFIWAYQGGAYPGSNPPVSYLGISESKMSGPNGDISNSYRSNDMPQCGKTYRVYTFNYGRGTAEAIESWGHQLEAEISHIDNHFFRDLFQGPNYPNTLNVDGRCGSVHNPPNARFEYDRDNTISQNSDCLEWNPDSLGPLTQISCQNWGCDNVSDTNNPALNYQVWNWQNLPGKGNQKTYQGKRLRNLWDIHGDFDRVVSSNRTIFAEP